MFPRDRAARRGRARLASKPWREAIARLPAGPVLVGPPAPGARRVRGAGRAAAEAAIEAGRPVYLLDPEPEAHARGSPGRPPWSLCSWRPGRGPSALSRRSLASARRGRSLCAPLFPLIPGWTAEDEAIEALADAAAAGGAASLTALVPAADGEGRRAIVEARSRVEPDEARSLLRGDPPRRLARAAGRTARGRVRRPLPARGLARRCRRGPAGGASRRGNASGRGAARGAGRARGSGRAPRRAPATRPCAGSTSRRAISRPSRARATSGRSFPSTARSGSGPRRRWPRAGGRTVSRAGGIYVHLPYCASRCGYCAFVVTTDGSSRDRYLEALEREAALLAPEAERLGLRLGLPRRRDAVAPAAGGGRAAARGAARDVPDRAGRRDHARGESRGRDPGGGATPGAAAGVNRVSVGVQSLRGRRALRRRPAARRRARARRPSRSLARRGPVGLGRPHPRACRSRPRRASAGASRRLLRRRASTHVSVYLLEVEKIEDDRGGPAAAPRALSLRRRPGRHVARDGRDARRRGLRPLRDLELGARRAARRATT